MARRRPLRSGPGVHVPEGMGGYPDAGGVGMASRLHGDTDYLQAIESTRRRMRLVTGLSIAGFLVICIRLVSLTFGPSSELAGNMQVANVDLRARADIVDRNGELLATNLLFSSLIANTARLWDDQETVASIARVLPRLKQDVMARRIASGRRYVQLARDLTPQEKQTIFALGLPGLEFPQHEKRIYPRGRDASHVIGFVDAGNRGIAGVEKSLEQEIVDAAMRGEEVALSLDMRVQHVLQDELARSRNTFRAQAAAGIVLDATTGEVLAMASLPDFDPNAPTALPEKYRFNQVTKGVYELGSVFKMFTIAMALDQGTVTLNDRYDATKPLRIASYTINDFHGKNRWLSVRDIIVYSSNIGAVKLARAVGIPAHQAFLRKLGFYERTAIELPELGTPKVPDRWREIRAATISYGHGIAISPLHLASAAAALVNGGRLISPTIKKREQGKKVSGYQVISPATSRQMRDLLRMVVTEGTGSQADVLGYSVGGKTGTAEKSQRGRYSRTALLSSFVASFPTDKPKYIVFVMLDEPKGTQETFGYATAGWTAAPLVHNIIKRIGPILGVRPERETADGILQAMLRLPR